MPYEETLAAFRGGANAQAAEMAQLDLVHAVALEDDRGAADALCMLARVALRTVTWRR